MATAVAAWQVQEEEQRRRFYLRLYRAGLYPYAAYAQVKKRRDNMGKKVKGEETERRKFIVHGREFWVTKAELREELPDMTDSELEEAWNNMGKKAKRGAVRIDVQHPTPEAAEAAGKPKAKRERKAPSDEELLAALKNAFKGTPLSSRQISDAPNIADPEVGRQAVRSAMKRLIAAGKVEGVKPKEGRAALLYKPKA